MYNVKGPSKIVAKTARRGVAKNLEPFRDHGRNKLIEDDNCNHVPKPVFNSNNITKRGTHAAVQKEKESISPEHEEIFKYINDSWSAVCSEIHQGTSRTSQNGSKSEQLVLYYEDDPCPQLQDFKPFDLVSWWGKRLFTYITSSVDEQS